MIQLLIAIVFSFGLLTGCGNGNSKSKPDFSRLPKKVEVFPAGQVNYISPKALVDSLNMGWRPPLYFIQDLSSADPSLTVILPGMQIVNIGEAVNVIVKQPRSQAIYLICQYGDDSKRMAKELAKEGFNCYYLDGGTYNLLDQVKKNGWKLPL